jgi:hypothetical protein
MPAKPRPVRTALVWCALAIVGSPTLSEQDGVRPYRSPVREAYEPRVADNSAAKGAGVEQVARVAILGTVSQPGTYVCPGGTGLGALLSAVGGLTPESSGGITLIRQGRNQGTLAFDLSNPDFSRFGALLDGDVAVFHSPRGVRTAHYQWTVGDQPANGLQPFVQNAAREQLIYIACIGLAEHPVVISVPAPKATESSLLVEMLGMHPDSIRRGVRPLLKTTSYQSEALPDGSVLAFDLRAIGPQGISAHLNYPPPSPMPQAPAAATDAPLETPTKAPAAVPSSPASDDAPAAETQPLPTPVSRRQVTPTGDQRIATDGHKLNEALPGFPFVIRDQIERDPVWTDAVDVGSQDRLATSPAAPIIRPVLVARGPGATPRTAPADADARDRTTILPAGSLLTNAELDPNSSRGRSDLRPSRAAVAPSSPAKDIGRAGMDSAASPQSNFGVIIGLAVATTLTLLAGWLGMHEYRRRRGQPAAAVHSALPATSQRAPEAATPLQELLENRLPMVEEPAIAERITQLHGEVVGQRRLRVDSAHRLVPAPHFSRVPTPEQVKRQERLQRHLVAATAAAERRPAPARAVSTAAPKSTTPREVHPVRYDIVQPETTQPTPQFGGRRPESTRPLAATPGDLLARVLSSLREES